MIYFNNFYTIWLINQSNSLKKEVTQKITIFVFDCIIFTAVLGAIFEFSILRLITTILDTLVNVVKGGRGGRGGSGGCGGRGGHGSRGGIGGHGGCGGRGGCGGFVFRLDPVNLIVVLGCRC